MKNAITDRILAIVAVASLLAVGIALVSQHVFDLAPCAWCVLQRLLYVGVAAASIVALGLRQLPGAQRVLAAVAFLFSIGGAAAAVYQHNVASHLLSCSQTFADRFMTQSGLDESLPSIFGIYATCADASVDVLGLKYEIWSLFLFALMAVALLVACLRGGRKQSRIFS